MPAFLAVTNTQSGNDRAIATNAERVVAARLRDARSSGTPIGVGLEARLERLETVAVSQTARVVPGEGRADRVAGALDCRPTCSASPDSADAAARAARLAKADLATDMVREFTELQGTMGGVYAREAGEPEPVWKAIYHHYLPVGVEECAAGRRALGAARVTLGGRCRWPTSSIRVVGLFLAGERPTGSRDPFGLRREAHGIIRVLLDAEALTGLR